MVNCAGQWAKAVGLLCGVDVPLHSAEHFYVVTEAIEGVRPDLPILRDPDGYTYVKEEVGGLVVGGFEPEAKPWVAPDALPYPFEFQLLEEDWDHFSVLMESAVHRIPALQHTGLKKLYNGPESFTPDNQFILGEAPGLRGFFVGAGFNSVGIASGGGAGRALADWIVEGEPTSDLAAVDIRRFAPFNANNRWLRDRVGEVLGLHYAVPWPNRELATARPFRRSPLHHLLAGKGAVFGSKMGWERPNVFAPSGHEPPELDYTWGRPDWLAWSTAEQIGDPRARGRLRRDVLRQAARGRPGRRDGAAAPVHGRRRGGAGPGRLHRHAQRAGRLRGRRDGDPLGARPLPAGDECRLAGTRRGLDRAAPSRRRARLGGRRLLGLRRPRRHGPGVAGASRPPRLGRPVRRRVPVLDEPGDRARLRHRAGHPDHLRRRVGLGALRPDRVRRRRLRGPGGGRVRPRSRRRGVLRHQQPPARQGLPGLRLRPHPGLHPARGRACASPASWQRPSTSSVGARSSRPLRPGPGGASSPSGSAIPTPCSGAASSSCTTVRRPARSARRRGPPTCGAAVGLAYVWRRDRGPVGSRRPGRRDLGGDGGRRGGTDGGPARGASTTRPRPGSGAERFSHRSFRVLLVVEGG